MREWSQKKQVMMTESRQSNQNYRKRALYNNGTVYVIIYSEITPIMSNIINVTGIIKMQDYLILIRLHL